MSDSPVDPFGELPDELRAMIERLGGQNLFAALPNLLAGGGAGPVNWELAGQAARQLAADGDRAPTPDERARAERALALAEHWLDASTLPSPTDSGRLLVVSRQEWVHQALSSMRLLVEPVAAASTRSLSELTRRQIEDVDLEELGLGPLAGMLGGLDASSLADMIAPMGATLTGLQAGQVLGELSRQMLGQYDLGLPTAPRATAAILPVNVSETFEGWDLDPEEVTVTLLLREGAHRRLFHAVPWLEAHLHGLVAQFANGVEVDVDQLEAIARELMSGVDPEDPESMRAALARSAEFRLEPTDAQRRVLERLQGVLSLVRGWAEHESRRAAGGRLPALDRIDEILRRRRAVKGDGEELLERLLGLDLRPEDEGLGERFVDAVEDARGAELLRRSLAHPENLPDTTELREPDRWLRRMESGADIPDDLSSLFASEAPIERSADERARDLAEETDADPGREGGDDDGRDDPRGTESGPPDDS